MPFPLHPFTAADFPALFTPILDVYRLAFAPPPYHRGEGEVIAFAATLKAHTTYPGFCGFWAGDPHGQMIGFTYGFSGGPGQFWHDTLAAVLPAPILQRWLTDYLELVELAVCPDHQRQGIGLQLHDQILACTHHAAAALTTAQVETPALRLYQKRGWRTIAEHLIFPANPAPLRLMAIDLSRGSV